MFWNSIQCNLRVCRLHSSAPMQIRTPNVIPASPTYARKIYHHVQTKTEDTTKKLMFCPALRATSRVRLKNTWDSCECARESAHSRRYDAMFDTIPSANSMVLTDSSTQISYKS